MKSAPPSRLASVAALLVTAILWAALTLQSALASPPTGPSVKHGASGKPDGALPVAIDEVQSFSSSSMAVYITGQADCPAGANLVVNAKVLQSGSGGLVVTGSATAPSTAGGSVTTQPGGKASTASGAAAGLPCNGEGTSWQVVAYYKAGASFGAGPADVCVQARLTESAQGSQATVVCRTVELIGG
jgi:hypothetical protein